MRAYSERKYGCRRAWDRLKNQCGCGTGAGVIVVVARLVQVNMDVEMINYLYASKGEGLEGHLVDGQVFTWSRWASYTSDCRLLGEVLRDTPRIPFFFF